MTRRARVIAMVQLPPPMHGAAKMNLHAITALAKDFDLHVIEMRFARNLADITRPTIKKLLIALLLAVRPLIWQLKTRKQI